MTRNQITSITPDADGFTRINGIEVAFTDSAGTSLTNEGRAMIDAAPQADDRDAHTRMLDYLHG